VPGSAEDGEDPDATVLTGEAELDSDDHLLRRWLARSFGYGGAAMQESARLRRDATSRWRKK
jgi:hypothetical protein